MALSQQRTLKRTGRARAARFEVGDLVIAKRTAPRDFRGRRGIVTETGGLECRVEFEDGRRPTTGYLKASSLDR